MAWMAPTTYIINHGVFQHVYVSIINIVRNAIINGSTIGETLIDYDATCIIVFMSGQEGGIMNLKWYIITRTNNGFVKQFFIEIRFYITREIDGRRMICAVFNWNWERSRQRGNPYSR